MQLALGIKGGYLENFKEIFASWVPLYVYLKYDAR